MNKKKVAEFLEILLSLVICCVLTSLCSYGAEKLKKPTPTPTNTPMPTATPVRLRGKLLDMIANNKISVEVRGSGIDEVELDLTRLVDEALEVEISAGTMFLSVDGSVQNMMVVESLVVRLDLDMPSLVEAVLDVACTNMHRSIPYAHNELEIVPAPDNQELADLAVVLDRADEYGIYYSFFSVIQAAIWIVTDNADFNGLGTLVSTSGGYGGFGGVRTRMISYEDAAMAMFLVEQAGIDITLKNIWADRYEILVDIQSTNPVLADWMYNHK